MGYKLSDLVKKVRVVMDKDMTSTALTGLGDVDTLSVNDIIKDSIPRAIRFILQSAPLYLIDTSTDGTAAAKESSTTVNNVTTTKANLTLSAQGDGYVGKFKLPDDFLRLVSVRMESWKRNARGITEDDEEYSQQLSVFAGIRGNASNPIAAVVQGSDGLYMELYSCTQKDTLQWFRYIAMPDIDTSNDGSDASKTEADISIPTKLVDAIIYLAASLAFESLGSKEQSDELAKTALALAGIGSEG